MQLMFRCIHNKGRLWVCVFATVCVCKLVCVYVLVSVCVWLMSWSEFRCPYVARQGRTCFHLVGDADTTTRL